MNASVTYIQSAIDAAILRRAPLQVALDGIATERADLQRALKAATDAQEQAASGLSASRAGNALGEVTGADLSLARAGMVAAEKAVAKARLTIPEVDGCLAAEQRLSVRIAAVDDNLSELRATFVKAQREAAVQDLVATFHVEKAEYTRLASMTMLALGKAFAQHTALDAAGVSLDLVSPSLRESALGSFRDSPLQGSFADARQAEADRLAAAGFAGFAAVRVG